MDSLADNAAELIREAQEYQTLGAVSWSNSQRVHVYTVDGVEVSLGRMAAELYRRREEIIAKIIQHLFAEVGQSQFSGGHGSRSAYVKGCRGLLCRRAQREALREREGQSASARFAVPDELLDEAESRILPEEVVGHIRYSDRVVSA